MARIAFCQDAMTEYIGFMYMSAVLKEAGHTVDIFIGDEMNRRRFLGQLESFNPDIVGFSVLSHSVNWSLRAGRKVKETLGAITVYGNVHVMLNPEIIEDPGVDIVCLGEGEFPMKELADCVDQGRSYSRIEGFWVKTGDGIVKNEMRKELVDIEKLPFHDRGIYDKYFSYRHSKCLNVLNGRGCPFRCTFCSNPVLMERYGGKRYIRKLAPERAIREIEYHLGQRDVRFIDFMDEVFWVKNEWLREFLTLYKERIRLPFRANFRFGSIREQDVKLMAEAGAAIMAVCVEIGDENLRRTLLRKYVKDQDVYQVTEWFRKYKIAYDLTALFGLPGVTVQDHLKQLEFYRKTKPKYVWTTFFTPLPGTELTKQKAVQDCMPTNKDFALTFHHDMYLELPDKRRLVNLKKVYFLLVLWPRASPFLVWLTRFRIPLLFDLMFFCHYSWYARAVMRISWLRFLEHIKSFIVNPVLKKVRVLRT